MLSTTRNGTLRALGQAVTTTTSIQRQFCNCFIRFDASSSASPSPSSDTSFSDPTAPVTTTPPTKPNVTSAQSLSRRGLPVSRVYTPPKPLASSSSSHDAVDTTPPSPQVNTTNPASVYPPTSEDNLDPSSEDPEKPLKRKRAPRKLKLKPTQQLLHDTSLGQELKTNGVSSIARRPVLVNAASARELVKQWGIDQMENVTVIDAYAGAGAISQALLELNNVKRVIAIEDAFRFQPYLDRLKTTSDEQPGGPGRFIVRRENPFYWETYSDLEKAEMLADVPKVAWDEPHPNLFFIAQLPHSKYGSQHFVQLTRVVEGANAWFFKYGRMRMGFLGEQKFFDKILAPPGSATFHKLAVVLPTLVDIQPLSVPLTPSESHFHLSPSSTPSSAVLVTPHMTPLCSSSDSLDFVTKTMYITKTTAWQKAVAGLAVGAGNLIPKMVEQGAPKGDTKVNELTLSEWIAIADVFDAWPFRPANFEDMEFGDISG